MLALFAALPLRGYASAIKSLCDAHHGGTQTTQLEQALHEHAAGHNHAPQPPASHDSGTATLCSLCATCSVGAPLAPESPRMVMLDVPRVARIPYITRYVPGVSPDPRDRPPLDLSR